MSKKEPQLKGKKTHDQHSRGNIYTKGDIAKILKLKPVQPLQKLDVAHTQEQKKGNYWDVHDIVISLDYKQSRCSLIVEWIF